ncbi:hypothetical protein PilKf_01157 [Pillotina sp. SPG140]
MKKIVISIAMVLLMSTAASAQFKWGVWSRFGIVPFNTGGTDSEGNSATTAHTTPSWGGDLGVSAELTASFTADNIGMVAAIQAGGNAITGGDNIYGWWKPSKILKLNIGKLFLGTLRGGYSVESIAGFGASLGIDGEDGIFTRFGIKSGAVLEFTPTENFFAGATLDVNPGSATGAITTENAFKNIHVAAGYTLANVGVFKAGYIGNAQKKLDDFDDSKLNQYDGATQRIELAFKSSLVEEVPFEVGFKVRIDPVSQGYSQKAASETDKTLINDTTKPIASVNRFNLAGGVTINTVENIPITGIVTYGFGKDDETDDSLNLYLNLEYKRLPVFTIGGSIGTKFVFDDKDASYFGFDAYISKPYSNGSIKIGIAAQQNGLDDAGNPKPVAFAVPILINCAL